MTKKTSSNSTSPPTLKKSVRRQPTSRPRAWHVKISLHPASLMVLLCTGVLLTGSTIAAFGDSYDVTAVVPAAALTEPALILAPANNSHLTAAAVNVTGSCPANSYVRLTLNSAGAGSSLCNNNAFSITASLQSGSNSLNVQDYNLQDQAGPSTASSVVYYDPSVPITPGPPVAPAIELRVMEVDDNIAYVSRQDIKDISNFPTFSGSAPAFSTVTLLLHSDPITCTTKADANGYWECTLTTFLPPGEHTVAVSAVTLSGKRLTLPVFRVRVLQKTQAYVNPVTPPGSQIPPTINLPIYQYHTFQPGQPVPLQFLVSGGRAPFTIIVDWGDNSTSTYQQLANGSFNSTHTYRAGKARLVNHKITIRIIDADGNVTLTQFPVVTTNPSYYGPALSTTKSASPGSLLSIKQFLHNWLWLLWPAYGIVLLMLASFYLGERRERGEEQSRAKRPHAVAHRKKHA